MIRPTRRSRARWSPRRARWRRDQHAEPTPTPRSARRQRTTSSARSARSTATLGTIGRCPTRSSTLQSGGQSTADLENQRDAGGAALSQMVERQRAGAAERRHVDHHRRRSCRLPTHGPARSAVHQRRERAAGHVLIPAAAFRRSCWTASTSPTSSPAASSAPTSRCATRRCRPTRPSWTSSRRTWPASSRRRG